MAIPPLNQNIGGNYLVNREIQKALELQESQLDDEVEDEES